PIDARSSEAFGLEPHGQCSDHCRQGSENEINREQHAKVTSRSPQSRIAPRIESSALEGEQLMNRCPKETNITNAWLVSGQNCSGAYSPYLRVGSRDSWNV